MLFIQNDLLTQLFSEEKSSNKVHFVLNSEKENSQCFDFNQDEILNFIQVPTFISVQNQDEKTFSLLEEKFKLGVLLDVLFRDRDGSIGRVLSYDISQDSSLYALTYVGVGELHEWVKPE